MIIYNKSVFIEISYDGKPETLPTGAYWQADMPDVGGRDVITAAAAYAGNECCFALRRSDAILLDEHWSRL